MVLRWRERRRQSHPPRSTDLFGCFTDNFGVLIHDPGSGATASIDAPEAAPVEAALKRTGWRLTDILVTHHHGDHTGGMRWFMGGTRVFHPVPQIAPRPWRQSSTFCRSFRGALTARARNR